MSLIITAQWVEVPLDLSAQCLPIKDEQLGSLTENLILFHSLNFNVW